MSSPSALPLMADGTLPPTALLWRWLCQQAQAGTTQVMLEHLPSGNGALPDLLAGAGVRTLRLERNPVDRPFRWEGWCGGRVLVDAEQGDDTLPLHHGELPWSAVSGGIDPALTGLLDLARLEDANAASHGVAAGHGASWEHILAVCDPVGSGSVRRIPPLASHGAAVGDGRLGAWNPLPMARRTLVSLPAPRGTAPWGLIDQRGARHPVQVVEGPIGRELLTTLQLGALEAVSFEPLYDPVPGAHWEVSRTVLDNGRVRAEFDPLGQIVRLCCDGRFVDWSAPALQALVDGLPLAAQSTTTVLEDGPVRSRVAVTRSGERGTLHLTYTLHAHEAVLRVAATWDGTEELQLVCPTLVRGAPLEVAGELAAWTVSQRATAGRDAGEPLAGLRWARLCDQDRQGLALIGLRPLTLSVRAGRMNVHVERTASFALSESASPADSPALGEWALELGTPARAAAAAIPPAFRLVGDGVVTWWVGRPNNWRGELLLGQQHDRHVRCTLFVPDAQEVVRSDAVGTQRVLSRSADDDGFELDLGPGELANLRWR